MTRSRFASAFLAAILVFAPAVAARAQLTTATFYGRVTDSSGAVLGGTTVTLTNEGTGEAARKTTDAAGEFAFNFLPVGTYTLKIERDGFKAFESRGLALRAAESIRRSFALDIGNVAETVTVEGTASQVNTVAPEQRESFSQEEVTELPLGRRNFSNILRIGTGVTAAGDGGFRLNSLGRNGTKITVDGTDASGDTEGRGTSLYQGFNYIDLLSIEAIQEVQTVKGVIQAEYGHTLAGNVNVITRSGTNTWHGSLFENHQNEALNAISTFLTTKPQLSFNQFGGSLGGPIQKDHVFVFAAYEGYRERVDQRVQGQVPTQRLRDALIAAQPAFRPALESLPLPNQPHPATAATAQFQDTRLSRAHDNHAVVKANALLPGQSHLALTYSRGRPFRVTPRVSEVNTRTWTGVQERVTASFVKGGSNWTAESRVGYNLNKVDRIDGFWDTIDPGRSESFFGGRRVAQISGLGFSTADSEIVQYGQGGPVWSAEQKYARTAGKHSLKFGGVFSRRTGGRSNIENARVRYENEADMLANIPSRVQVTFGVNPYKSRSWELGFFAQDDWRVSPKLVVNLGVRYDYFSKFVAEPSTDAPAGLFNLDGLIDPQTFTFGPFRDPMDPFEDDAVNIGPRLGFAYNPDGQSKNVVRGGFGVMFSPLIWGTFNNAVANAPNQPFRVTYSGKTEVAQNGLRFPIYNEDILPLVAGGSRILIADIFNPHIHAPYSMNLYLGYQRELTPSLMVETAFAGNRGVSFLTYRTFNPVDRVTGRRPNPNLGEGNYLDNSQNTVYYSWQTSVRKRHSGGLSFGAHYTWGKGLSYAGGDIGATFTGDASSSVQDFQDLKGNRGPSTGDVTHYFTTDWLWELPTLPGRGKLPRLLLGGWQLAGLFRAQTGTPLMVSEPSAIANSRPDLLDARLAINDDYRATRQYLNPAAFAVVPKSPVSGATLRAGTYGNNALRGPGLWILDLSVAKNFALTGDVKLQVRADAFNALNHVNYTDIQTSTEARDFGRLRSTTGPRVVQLNARLSF
jgi:outer membrane receptor protein involved in Fe transport